MIEATEHARAIGTRTGRLQTRPFRAQLAPAPAHLGRQLEQLFREALSVGPAPRNQLREGATIARALNDLIAIKARASG